MIPGAALVLAMFLLPALRLGTNRASSGPPPVDAAMAFNVASNSMYIALLEDI